MLTHVDVDQDGLVSYEEFIPVCFQVRSQQEQGEGGEGGQAGLRTPALRVQQAPVGADTYLRSGCEQPEPSFTHGCT